MRIFLLLITVSIFINITANNVVAIDTSLKEINFKEFRSEHFLIRYQEGVSKDYVWKIKKVAERFYRVITQEFNLIRNKLWLWENRAKVFIAKDKESYLNEFKCSSWSGACVNYLKKIIYTYPDQSRFNSIFIHELTHIIFHEYLGRGHLPLWLDEGIATYMEDKHSQSFYQRQISSLKRIIKNKKYIPLTELSKVTSQSLAKSSPDYVNRFYLESFSVVNFFMKRYGKYHFSRFLSYLKGGDDFNSAMSKSFRDCRDLVELQKQWIRFYQR